MAVQALIFREDFAHRVNNNGTVDSICLRCFGTVASLPKEMDLEQKEHAHTCWPLAQYTSKIEPGGESGCLAISPRLS